MAYIQSYPLELIHSHWNQFRRRFLPHERSLSGVLNQDDGYSFYEKSRGNNPLSTAFIKG